MDRVRRCWTIQIKCGCRCCPINCKKHRGVKQVKCGRVGVAVVTGARSKWNCGTLNAVLGDGSMTRVTGFHCINDNGQRVLCDAFGNNVAFDCPNCGHPMLAIILPNQNRRGSTPDNPAVCRHCGFRGWLTTEPAKQLLRLQYSDSDPPTLPIPKIKSLPDQVQALAGGLLSPCFPAHQR